MLSDETLLEYTPASKYVRAYVYAHTRMHILRHLHDASIWSLRRTYIMTQHMHHLLKLLNKRLWGKTMIAWLNGHESYISVMSELGKIVSYDICMLYLSHLQSMSVFFDRHL